MADAPATPATSPSQRIDHRAPRRGWVSRVAGLLVRLRLPLAAIGFLLMAVVYPASQRLEFDRSVASMFKPDDRAFVAYQSLKEAFGGNSIVILVYRDPSLASAEGIERNEALAERVRGIRGVHDVLSPSLLSRAVEKFQPASLLSDQPALFRDTPVANGFDELFSGYTHAADHSRGAIVAMLEPNHPPETIAALSQLASHLRAGTDDDAELISDAALVGEPVLVHDGFSLIERDGARLATMTVVLLSIVVIVSLADARFVLLTSVMILWAVWVTRAMMVWIGIELSLVSTILTAIVTVIVVTAVLHLGVRFRRARSRGDSQRRATVRSISLLMLPIFWTCATDAAGFAALYHSRILPIRQFGLMIAISAMAVCVAAVLFAPAAMMLPGVRLGAMWQRHQLSIARRLQRISLRISLWAVQHPKSCLSLVAACCVVAIVGLGRTETETSFLNNFRAHSPVVRAYGEVEKHFGGAGVWDVVLDAPEELSPEYLEHVRVLEEDLRAIDIDGVRLTKVLSLADADAIAAMAPLSDLFSSSSRLSAMYLVMPAFFDALVTDAKNGKRKLRIMLRSGEQTDSDRKLALIRAVEEKVQAHVASDHWIEMVGRPSESSPAVTGYYVLMARLVSQLLGDQWRCFAASGFMVWLLLMLATRSLRLATSALIPNLLPIFLVLALVGLVGGKINMGAAMIAAVSVGLSIDGSVHFLAGYRRHRRRGHGSAKAATHAAGNIGVPLFLATVALVVGFGVLSTSEFVPTATFGMLVAAALALGTAVNLTLLPAAVAWIDR